MAPAQTYLEKLAEWNGVEINLPEGVTASQNEEPFFLYPITESNPYPTLSQYYKFERSAGEMFFNASFSGVTSVIEHTEKGYLVIATMPQHKPGHSEKASGKEQVIKELLKGCCVELGLGNASGKIEPYELDQVKKMVKIYPRRTARKYFNAGGMVSLPMSLQHNVLYGKYTHGVVVSMLNSTIDSSFSLIFLMTDDNYTRFDEFLKDFKGAFRFK